MQQLAARSSSRVNLVRYARMLRIDRTVTSPLTRTAECVNAEVNVRLRRLG